MILNDLCASLTNALAHLHLYVRKGNRHIVCPFKFNSNTYNDCYLLSWEYIEEVKPANKFGCETNVQRAVESGEGEAKLAWGRGGAKRR